MLKGWLGGKVKAHHHGHAMSLNALDEIASIEDAMAAIMHIMNDDIDTAEKELSKGSSAFHQLGKGVVTFMRATLGFEQETMREASEQLSTAENAAYEQQKRATGNTSAYQSSIFPAGTEYAICLAEARLMSAIVGVLNESLTEAIKSFYKLRKAYITLEGIAESERNYLADKGSSSLASSQSEISRPESRRSVRSVKKAASLGKTSAAPSTTSLAQPPPPVQKEENIKEKENVRTGNDEDFEFVDADETHSGMATPSEYLGHLGAPTPTNESEPSVAPNPLNNVTNIQSSASSPNPSPPAVPQESVPDLTPEMTKLTLTETVKPGPDPDIYGKHPIDMFITSGMNFSFGILLLLISLTPPAFSTLLKIVGFKGDRERGIQMLWQATKYDNIHGAMAGLVLFLYYNNLLGFCDIVAPSGPGSYPAEKCKELLATMRQRYPKSHLWLLEEAHMLAADKNLEASVAFMRSMGECPLKQLEALQVFERSLCLMYMHNYEATSQSFQECITLNNWSHGLYYYICGSAHVEAYRRALLSNNPIEANEQKRKAKELYAKVHSNIGRKKFMARQLPFDIFVARKLAKWEARSKAWNCDLIDAVGVSPLEELIYFWNGYKRMSDAHLTTSLENLAWSESELNKKYWEREEGLDEKAILTVLRAATLRCLDRTDEAKIILQRDIIAHDKLLFKGGQKDSWTAPCARYEMAASLWREADGEGRPEDHMEALGKCKTWLVEVSAWESYDLDARIGMKVTTAKGTLRRYGIEC